MSSVSTKLEVSTAFLFWEIGSTDRRTDVSFILNIAVNLRWIKKKVKPKTVTLLVACVSVDKVHSVYGSQTVTVATIVPGRTVTVLYDVEIPSQPSSRLCVECHRGQSWAPYCSLSTLQTWSQWMKAMACHHKCMPTMLRCMAPVVLMQSTPSRRRSPSVSALSPAGWSITDCQWIATKRKSYGAQEVDDNTSFRVQLCQLTALWLSPWGPLAI